MGRGARIGWRRPLGLLAIALVAPTLASCGVRGLAFREDTRLDIVEPGDREEVTLPVTVRWTAPDIGGTFEVLVDRAPQPPGETVAWFARNDDDCRDTSACPDAGYLAERGVFTTTDPQHVVERLPEDAGDGRRRELHEVTVVLLDEHGRRIGESAWSVELQIDRDGDA